MDDYEYMMMMMNLYDDDDEDNGYSDLLQQE